LENFLSHEVPSPVANAGIEVPVIGGVLGALHALSSDPHVAILAEAAALIPILIEPAGGPHEWRAGLSGAVVDLPVRASPAHPVDEVEPEIADAGLLGVRVDFVFAAFHLDAGPVDAGEPGTAPAGVVLGEVGLVDGAALANVLDDLESGLALANAVDEYLVGSAGVDAVAPHGDGVVFVAPGAFAADAVDGVVVFLTLTVESLAIQYLVFAAAVAVQVGAGRDLRGRFAVFAVLGVGCRE
jgi:hypothetical protein